METGEIVALTALGISSLSILMGYLGFKKTSRKDYVDSLSGEIHLIKERLHTCELDRKSLRDENEYLRKKIMKIEFGMEKLNGTKK